MYTINKSKVNNRICEIVAGDYFVYIDDGTKTAKDFIVKYRHKNNKNKRGRKINHIVWTADLLMKMSAKKRLGIDLIKTIISFWDNLVGFSNKPGLNEISKLIQNNYALFNNGKFNGLNNVGYFNIELLSILIITIAAQEKTNNVNAHRFKDILCEMVKNNYSLPQVIYFADKR